MQNLPIMPGLPKLNMPITYPGQVADKFLTKTAKSRPNLCKLFDIFKCQTFIRNKQISHLCTAKQIYVISHLTEHTEGQSLGFKIYDGNNVFGMTKQVETKL